MQEEHVRYRAGNLPYYMLRFLGIVLFILAGLGLWYNLTVLQTNFLSDPSQPYFQYAFYSMTAICMACYLVLLYIAVSFIRLRTSWFKAFISVIVFEAVYFFSTGFFWLDSDWGHSIAAATGVANGGLMFQLFILFPIWGPLLGRWATKAIDTPQTNNERPYPEQEVARLSDWGWAAVNFVIMFVLASILLALAWYRLYPGTFSPGYMTCFTLLLSTANALLSVRQRRWRRRKRIQRLRNDRWTRELCLRCGYNLTGNISGVCPECGEEHSILSGLPRK